MFQITLELAGASRVHGIDPSVAILLQLEALTAWNVAALEDAARRGRPLPELYRAGVRYQREVGEKWLDAPRVLELRRGDCEDLAAWRAAELRRAGNPAAKCTTTVRELPGGRRLFHVIVDVGNGTTEDPSRVLGMGQE